jgi:hypothetical protein
VLFDVIERKYEKLSYLTCWPSAGSGPIHACLGPDSEFPPGNPGSINYVEGQASIGGETLNPKSIGSIELEKGQSLTTQAGKVEILLTPGVFLRKRLV